MPDFLKNEETEIRTQSLCLFGVPGITSNRRCENCPGPLRTLQYHQKRCPLDSSSFSPGTAEKKSEIDPKLVGSSSKLPHDADAVGRLSTQIAGCKLDGTARRSFRRSKSDPGIRNPTPNLSVSVPHVDVRVKRKADQPESSLRNELGDAYAHKTAHHKHTEAVQNAKSNEGAVSRGDGSSLIAEWMQNILSFQQKRQQKSFRADPQRTEPRVEGRLGIPEDVPHLLNSLSIGFQASPVHTQDDHQSGSRDMTISDPLVDVGAKLKAADILNQPESSSRTGLAGAFSHKATVHTEADERAKSNKGTVCLKDGSSDVAAWLQNKPPNRFEDLEGDEPCFHELSLGVSTDVPASWSSLLNVRLDANPNDMQEDHHSGRASSFGLRVPGVGMITERQGVHTCHDGIFNINDAEEGHFIAMEIEEPSIDQLRERSYHS